MTAKLGTAYLNTEHSEVLGQTSDITTHERLRKTNDWFLTDRLRRVRSTDAGVAGFVTFHDEKPLVCFVNV